MDSDISSSASSWKSNSYGVGAAIIPAEGDRADSLLLPESRAGPREPDDIARARKRSLYVICFVTFLGSVGFSVVLSTLWVYLEKLGGGQSFLGWVVASYSLGQLLASPVFGVWSNYRGAREPLIVSTVINIVGNVAYCFCDAIPSYKTWALLVTRFVVGFGAGNVSVCRSFVSAVTTEATRSGAMSAMSAAQGMGFILGPVVGAAFSPVKPGIDLGVAEIDYLTLPAYFCALGGLASVIILCVAFKEVALSSVSAQQVLGNPAAPPRVGGSALNVNHHHQAGDESSPLLGAGTLSVQHGSYLEEDEESDEELQLGSSKSKLGLATGKNKPVPLTAEEKAFNREANAAIDKCAVLSLIIVVFVVLVVFSIFETMGTPLTMDEYGWDKQKADLFTGIIFGVAGIIGVGMFIIAKPLGNRIGERQLLLGSMFILLVAFVCFLPWGENRTDCTDHPWCADVPELFLWQFLMGSVFVALGYPLASVTIYTLYSRVLGPAPQGLGMGLVTATGSAARMLGPIFVTEIYDYYGTRWTFVSVCGLVFLGVLVAIGTFKRLIPHQFHRKAQAELERTSGRA